MDGKEAYQIGLANRLVGCGTGVGQALQLATQIKKFPQECLRTDRRSAYYATFEAASQLEAMEYERANAVDIISQEGVEGMFYLMHKKGPKIHFSLIFDNWMQVDHTQKVKYLK